MTTSNLLGLGRSAQTFLCTFGQASGGFSGEVRLLHDVQYFSNSTVSPHTDAQIWADIRSVSDTIKGLPIVYVAVALISSGSSKGRYAYVGKTAKDLTARYSVAGPAQGGMAKVFQYFSTYPEQISITIYATSHPNFIEGWCYDAAALMPCSMQNIIDPNG